jgi:hypothetical protein
VTYRLKKLAFLHLDGVQYCTNEVSLLNSLINKDSGRVAAIMFVFLKIYLSAKIQMQGATKQ